MSKDSPRTSVLRDNDLIQKGQDDLIRRGDAREILEDEGFLERSLERLAAIPAVQPTVRPLVWVKTLDGGETCLTDERYSISYWEGEKLFVDRYTTMRRHHTIEAAKAAAQADYEARILSALGMQPTVSPELLATTNDVAAMVEALEQAKDFIDDQYACAESQAVQGEYVVKEARQLWYMLCAALARAKGETT